MTDSFEAREAKRLSVEMSRDQACQRFLDALVQEAIENEQAVEAGRVRKEIIVLPSGFTDIIYIPIDEMPPSESAETPKRPFIPTALNPGS